MYVLEEGEVVKIMPDGTKSRVKRIKSRLGK
jgi:hypothetical protein